jgi:uncharacterized membrane protein YqjE
VTDQQTLLQQVQALWRELPGLVSDRVTLFGLELQRASLALIQIVVLVVACGILGVTAWLVLWVGVIVGLVTLGLHIALALLLVLVLNAGAAFWAMRRVRTLLTHLSFAKTRRHLVSAAGAMAERADEDDPVVPPTGTRPPPTMAGAPIAH